jgi:hypothetical protein
MKNAHEVLRMESYAFEIRQAGVRLGNIPAV